MTERAQPACHMCGQSRRAGYYCLNCERWACWKHALQVAYWQPDKHICDRCAALPSWQRRAMMSDRRGA